MATIWTARLIALAILQQSLEMLGGRRWLLAWPWGVIREEFSELPAPVRRFLDFAMRDTSFKLMIALRVGMAVGLGRYPSWRWALPLLATNFLIVLRWRGPFNGGSDYMTSTVLLGLCFGRVGLVYIAFQLCLSYFISGVAKVRRREWRSGEALKHYLRDSVYDVPIWADRFPYYATAAWPTLIFECAFPLAFAGPHFCAAFLGLGILFHLANVYIFGLNRFFWTWLAAYPSVYFWICHGGAR